MQPNIIQRSKISDEVATRIEAMIYTGQFATGEQLPTGRELMKVFGVGRPAIREALFTLQKLGLVAVSNGVRARVTRPTPAVVFKSLSGAARNLLAQPGGITDFQDARMFFEVGLARRAARSATKADIRELAAALEANHDSMGDLALFEQTDVAFHYVLAKIARNPIFTAVHQAIIEWLTEQRHVALQVAGASRVAYAFHKRIFEAVAAKNPDKAEKAMRDHLLNVSDLYWRVRSGHHAKARQFRGGS
jgi:GntR family transcriptional regulator, sialic acid-inducible nan operon repressor